MLEATKKLVGEMKELEKETMKMFIGSDMDHMIDYMGSKELSLILKYFKLLHGSMDLMLEQASIMDEMNSKLDKLLEK